MVFLINFFYLLSRFSLGCCWMKCVCFHDWTPNFWGIEVRKLDLRFQRRPENVEISSDLKSDVIFEVTPKKSFNKRCVESKGVSRGDFQTSFKLAQTCRNWNRWFYHFEKCTQKITFSCWASFVLWIFLVWLVTTELLRYERRVKFHVKVPVAQSFGLESKNVTPQKVSRIEIWVF